MKGIIGVEAGMLASLSEQVLRDLGYAFIKNQGQNMTEFEVREPLHFLIFVENLAHAQVGFPFRKRMRIESSLELRPLIGSPEPEEKLHESYEAFFDRLQGKLPDDKWRITEALRP